MKIAELLAGGGPALAEGSVVERLRRDPRVRLDPLLAHAAFPGEPGAAAILGGIYREYLEIARAAGLPMLCFTATWRANPERARRAGLDADALNARAAGFLRAIIRDYPAAAAGGLMGCRGDAYRPEEALTRGEAARFHAAQAAALAGAGVDFLLAATMPAAAEALGMADAMGRTGVPYIVSFVIGRDGGLLDGTPLDEAIRMIDADAAPPPLAYFVNCAHPSALRRGHPRLAAFQGNTSRRPPHELEGLPELDGEPLAGFAADMLALGRRCGIRILGGCCGTDARHIRAIAAGLQATPAAFASGVNVSESPAGS